MLKSRLRNCASVAVWLGFLLAAPAIAGNALTDCNGSNSRLAVAGCSMLIAKGNLPDNELSIALNNRGIAYATEGLGELAISDFLVAARIDPSNALALNNLCHIWLDVHEAKRAHDACSRAIATKPEFYEALANRSLAHMALGDLAAALIDINRAIEINPGCPLMRANRGALHEQMGDVTAAISDYEAALAMSPDLDIALEGLARLRPGASLTPPRGESLAPARLARLSSLSRHRAHVKGCPPSMVRPATRSGGP